MIVEAVISWLIKVIGFFVAPIFDKVYALLHIDSNGAKLMIPSPLWDVVYTFTQYALALSPIALAWWVWRQIKA